jgi:hypothetical protein
MGTTVSSINAGTNTPDFVRRREVGGRPPFASQTVRDLAGGLAGA